VTLPTENPADRLVLDAVGAAFSALPSGARVAVAFSGGLDSTSLLDAVVRVAGASRCVALHIHHGLSPHADEWLAHCDAFARERGVTFEARHVDISRETGVSIEAAARDARYRALDGMCAGHDVSAMWLAQHADDQAETVLLQLLRGTGLAGLAAMAPERLAPGARFVRVRPLLHVLRAQLEQYAHARDLSWIEDESNADTRYARNALRHEVLPQLAVHFPGFRNALSRTATHAAAAQRLLDDLARIDMQQAARNYPRALSRDAVLALDDERAINLLRYWIRTLGLPAASTARLADALRQLRDVTRDHGMRVDHAGQSLRNYRDEIYWEAGESVELADETAIDARPVSELAWHGDSIWRLPQWRGTFVFAEVEADDPDAIAEPLLTSALLSARSRAGGERMRVDPNGSSRTLKNLFQERGVPSWKRDVPLLFSGDMLLFVPLIGVNREAAAIATDKAGANARRYLRLDWRPDVLIA
jgi:tRNA(Ile)-lysidine synthase